MLDIQEKLNTFKNMGCCASQPEPEYATHTIYNRSARTLTEVPAQPTIPSNKPGVCQVCNIAGTPFEVWSRDGSQCIQKYYCKTCHNSWP